MRHSPPRIDLFSDTKTRPSDAMKKAMVEAELGDEQADEDPTTLELCEHVADLLGKEKASVFTLRDHVQSDCPRNSLPARG